MRNVSDKSCREIQNTHFISNNFYFRKSNHLWDKVENYGGAGQDTVGNIIWRMRIACRIPKDTKTHSHNTQYLLLPPQQWMYEGAWMLRYTLRCLSCYMLGIIFHRNYMWFHGNIVFTWGPVIYLNPCTCYFYVTEINMTMNLSPSASVATNSAIRYVMEEAQKKEEEETEIK